MSRLQRKSLMTRLKNKLQRAIKEHSGSLLSNSSVIPEKKNFEYFLPINFYVKLCSAKADMFDFKSTQKVNFASLHKTACNCLGELFNSQ